jgi:hypothetical protein
MKTLLILAVSFLAPMASFAAPTKFCNYNEMVGPGNITFGSVTFGADSQGNEMVSVSIFRGDDSGEFGFEMKSGEVKVEKKTPSDRGVRYVNAAAGLDISMLEFMGGEESEATISGTFRDEKNGKATSFGGGFICHQ